FFPSRAPPRSPLFPYTTLFRSTALPQLERRVLLLAVVEKFSHPEIAHILEIDEARVGELLARARQDLHQQVSVPVLIIEDETLGSEEHTSELQSRENLVCRLLL